MITFPISEFRIGKFGFNFELLLAKTVSEERPNEKEIWNICLND
jgi:hypothetical protein